MKEKVELYKTAAEDVIKDLLPVADDFERAIQNIPDTDDTKIHMEGMVLIYNKLKKLLEQKGVKEIEAKEQDFDTDLHEAITKIPAPTDELKGKVVDVIEKGYTLNDKVIRFAKVVIGE
jgi:molecular chaperone GrpE